VDVLVSGGARYALDVFQRLGCVLWLALTVKGGHRKWEQRTFG
jgi:hypothetical protein